MSKDKGKGKDKGKQDQQVQQDQNQEYDCGDMPLLLALGEHDAVVLSMDPPEQGRAGRAWFLRVRLRADDQTIIHYVAGFPESLLLIYRMRKRIIGQIWKIRIDHQQLPPHKGLNNLVMRSRIIFRD